MTPAARITPLADGLDAAFADRGYQHWKAGATVMVSPLEPLADQATPGAVTGSADPSPAWDEVAGPQPRGAEDAGEDA